MKTKMNDLSGRPRRGGITSAARIADRVGRWTITIGGVGVIAAVLGIFIFVLGEAWPLFKSARVDEVGAFSVGAPSPVLSTGTDPYQEMVYVVHPDGVSFYRIADGQHVLDVRPEGLGGATITASDRSVTNEMVGVGTSDGRVLGLRVRFDVAFGEDSRSVTPSVEVADTHELFSNRQSVRAVSYRNDGSGGSVAAGASADGAFAYSRGVRRKTLMGMGRFRAQKFSLSDDLSGSVTSLAGDGKRFLLAGLEDGRVQVWQLNGSERPDPAGMFRGSAPGNPVTAMRFLFGDGTVVVGTAGGAVETWLPVRGQGAVSSQSFLLNHRFRETGPGITAIAVSGRDKQFATGDTTGESALHHGTSGQTFLSYRSAGPQISCLAYSPKADAVVTVFGDRLVVSDLDNPHPEITLTTLFGSVWYEGYSGPEHVWQSSGGSDEFEPKLGLIPLMFGTAKGTLYAMLFALPLAVLAAIYTSEFLGSEARTFFKPTVELMASLPSVILGFLAGLWLAPLLDEGVVGALLLFPVVPAVVVLAAWCWRFMPRAILIRLPEQSEIYALIPITLFAGWAAFALGPLVENTLMGGSFREWLFAGGTRYDQRNCLVVGFAMGFAVVPIVYTICEDALSSVPGHLRAGSLALGATPWQTAVRVVLPTASPGIFSAAMIGFGRAVGETMIVLMATGNTPILDWSVFNGMRTLSANIAVEIPEAPHEGTLYRVLFLTGLLLSGATFLLNTVAEIVRQKLRDRYSKI